MGTGRGAGDLSNGDVTERSGGSASCPGLAGACLLQAVITTFSGGERNTWALGVTSSRELALGNWKGERHAV
jgi:hypothetical protein